MERSVAVDHLGEGQEEPAGELLARAFRDDPLAVHMGPDPVMRARFLPAHFAAVVRYGQLFGVVHAAAGPLAGVAVWLPPGEGEVTADRVARAGLDRATDLLGAGAWDRFAAVVDHVDRGLHDAAPGPHWALLAIGVEPAAQGTGVGSALLRAGQARAAVDGMATALWTVQPDNVGFYQRQGYGVVAVGVEPSSGLRFWAFTRAPAP